MSAKINQKSVEALVDKAIASSKDHAELLMSAAIAAIQLAASEVGRIQPLNRLFHGVNRSDQDGIRFYMLNLANKYGPQTESTNGRTRGEFFLRMNRDTKEWEHVKSDKAKEARATFDKLPETDYRKVIFGSVENAVNAASRQFDFFASLSKLVERGIKEGVALHDLRAASNLIPVEKRPDLDAMKAKVISDAKAARERAEKLEASAAHFAGENVTKAETTNETAKAA